MPSVGKASLVLVAAFVFSSAQSAPLVNNIEEFEIHIIAHKRRVIEGAKLLRENRMDLFGDVPEALIVDYIRLHDINKLSAPPKGGEGQRRILMGLYRNFGRDIKTFSPEDRKANQAIVDELNQLDQARATEFFRRRGLLEADGKLKPLAEKLQRLEKIADLVDRGMDFVAAEEYGRTSMVAGSDFMKDPADAELARKDLEPNYKARVLDVHSYEIYRTRLKCNSRYARIP